MTGGRVSSYIPVLAWLPRARPPEVGRDLVAGLAAAAVVVPQALAYATLAGLPVQYGLYVCVVPMLAYAALGTSRVLSVSTTSTISILTATAVAGIAAADPDEYATATATLAVVTGAVLLAAGFLRLGVLADFISLPVLAGFKVGTGLVIAASQLGKVLGVPVIGDNFFEKTWSALTQLDDANGATVGLAAATVGGLLVLREFVPRVPGPLVGVALGILAVRAFDLVDDGVAVVPPVPSGAPSFEAPDASLVLDLLPAAAGDRSDVLRRVDRRCTDVRRTRRRSAARCRSGAPGPRCRQSRRRSLPGVPRRRRAVADHRQRPERRAVATRGRGHCSVRAADAPLPDVALRRSRRGDARCSRARCHHRARRYDRHPAHGRHSPPRRAAGACRSGRHYLPRGPGRDPACSRPLARLTDLGRQPPAAAASRPRPQDGCLARRGRDPGRRRAAAVPRHPSRGRPLLRERQTCERKAARARRRSRAAAAGACARLLREPRLGSDGGQRPRGARHKLRRARRAAVALLAPALAS